MKSDTRFKYILSFLWKDGNLKKLNSWFEIDEREYMWYILKGYELVVEEERVMWTFDGKLHREDGPAYISAVGSEIWVSNGKTHREDGPAVILNGNREWWLNDRQYHSEAEFNKRIKQLKIVQ